MKAPKPPKHQSVEKYELRSQEVAPVLAESVEEYAVHGGLRDLDYTSKIALASQRDMDQRALDAVVFKRNETVHDVTYRSYGAKGDGAADDEPAFTLAIAALSAGDTLYIPRGTYKLSDNVTVPAGNACVFESGAKISIDTAKTFTVNGTLIGDSHQIFAGAGTVDISGTELQWEIDPVWFGNSIVTTLTDQDATPSINRGRLFKTANTVATTITMFDDGIGGQRITVFFNDSLTTIDFSGTNLHGNAGSDWATVQDDSMDCVFDGTDWWCSVGGSGGGVPRGVLHNWDFKMVDAENFATPMTGETVSVTISQDGSAFNNLNGTPAVSEIGYGWYTIAVAAVDMAYDRVVLRATAANSAQHDRSIYTG